MAEDTAEAQVQPKVEEERSVGDILDSGQKERQKLVRAQYAGIGISFLGFIGALVGRLDKFNPLLYGGLVAATAGAVIRLVAGALHLKSEERSKQQNKIQ